MIHVLCADVSGLDKTDYVKLYHLASPERRHKADRYLRWEDALRCVAADALLRKAYGPGNYTVYAPKGEKPTIPERPDFHFNLSHSGNWVVIAYGTSPVGVDVESYREDTNIDRISRRFYTPEERAYCMEYPQLQYRRFYEVWTGKESFLKYLGTGLRKDLTSFSIFQPEDGVIFTHRVLSDGASLSLCCKDPCIHWKMLDRKDLLSPSL